MTIPTAPKFKRPVQFCLADMAEGRTCHRLPMHKGEHVPFVRGNGIPAPKAPATKADKADRRPAKAKTRVIAGVTYRLVAVKPKAVAEPAVRVIPEAKSRRRVASSTGR